MNLDRYSGFIDQILSDDLSAPKKQRHTIQRIYDRLRDGRSFDGDYTTVRDYVHPRWLRLKETFVPLAHPVGHAKANFGEAGAVICGVTSKVHFLVVALPPSDAIYVKAHPAETAEAFCEGHMLAFAFFGRIPVSILNDKTRLVVAKLLGDGTRKRSILLAAIQS
ncbi:MAG: IS21 family transposase, partial [Alphaproteobacteria bacterium]|nr:IS21 family transposase [Alphaproteobacteria bacterium]